MARQLNKIEIALRVDRKLKLHFAQTDSLL